MNSATKLTFMVSGQSFVAGAKPTSNPKPKDLKHEPYGPEPNS